MNKRIVFYKSLFALKPQPDLFPTTEQPDFQPLKIQKTVIQTPNNNKILQNDKLLQQLQEKSLKRSIRQLSFVKGASCGSCGGSR
jgi:hypothetical protein